jgi:hypothetical protein
MLLAALFWRPFPTIAPYFFIVGLVQACANVTRVNFGRAQVFWNYCLSGSIDSLPWISPRGVASASFLIFSSLVVLPIRGSIGQKLAGGK